MSISALLIKFSAHEIREICEQTIHPELRYEILQKRIEIVKTIGYLVATKGVRVHVQTEAFRILGERRGFNLSVMQLI